MRPLFSSPDFTLLGGGNHPVGEAKREARDHSLHELEIRKAHARHGSRKMNDKNRILSLCTHDAARSRIPELFVNL